MPPAPKAMARLASSIAASKPGSGSRRSDSVARAWAAFAGFELSAALPRAGSTASPRPISARLRLSWTSRSPRPSWPASSPPNVFFSLSGTRATAQRHAVRARSSSESRSMSRVIQPQALLSPIFERVCNAWLRACRHWEPSSLRSRGKTASDGRRVSAQDSMSRTKKSGSTAQRSTSVSSRSGRRASPPPRLLSAESKSSTRSKLPRDGFLVGMPFATAEETRMPTTPEAVEATRTAETTRTAKTTRTAQTTRTVGMHWSYS